MTFEGAMENIALVFEAVGVAIIVIGGVVALVRGVPDFGHFDRSSSMSAVASIVR